MRYAYGIFLGFAISGIIFMGSAVIRLTGFGIPGSENTVKGILLIWTLVSLAIVFIPLIILYFMRRTFLHEFLLFEIGGLSLFTPFWVALGTELYGDSWTRLYFDFTDDGGLVEAIPFPGGWMGIGAFLYIPITIGMIVFGIYLLRPSHIKEVKRLSTPSELDALGEESVSSGVEPSAPTDEIIDSDMPGVEPPTPTQSSIDELRAILMKLNTPDAIINAILSAGYASTTDLVATTPDQIAKVTGLDKMSAADLQMQVQKVLFYGHIVD